MNAQEKKAAQFVASQFMLPNLSLIARASETGNLSYMATISWNLLAGGMDYRTYKGANYEKQKAQLFQTDITRSKKQEFLDLKYRLEKTFVEVESKKKDIVKGYQDILDDARKRFAKGLLSSRNLNEDIRLFINSKSSLVSSCESLYLALSELSLLNADLNSIYHYM